VQESVIGDLEKPPARPSTVLGLLELDPEEGRRHTSRDAQRVRILAAMVTATAERGFVDVTVGDIVARAGVSRTTFYELFDGKLDCYLAAFDVLTDELTATLATSFASAVGDPVQAAFEAFFATIEAWPAASKFCLVDVYAAGPDAVSRRIDRHGHFAEVLARIHQRLLDSRATVRPIEPFDLLVVVSGVSGMVTNHVAVNGVDGLSALVEPTVRFVRSCMGVDTRDQ